MITTLGGHLFAVKRHVSRFARPCYRPPTMRSTGRCSTALGAALLLLCSSCRDAGPESEAAAPAPGEEPLSFPSLDPSAPPFEPRGRLRHWERVGETTHVELKGGETHSFHQVLLGTWCYAFLVRADEAATHVEATLVDPNGVPVQTEVGEGPRVALGLEESLCPYAAGRFTLRLRTPEPARAVFLVLRRRTY